MPLDEMMAEARRRCSPGACSCMGPLPQQRCSTCLAAMIARGADDRIASALLRLDGLRNGHARVCAAHAGDPCDCGHVATWERVRAELNGVAP